MLVFVWSKSSAISVGSIALNKNKLVLKFRALNTVHNSHFTSFDYDKHA
jgi:hypothetical protein